MNSTYYNNKRCKFIDKLIRDARFTRMHLVYVLTYFDVFNGICVCALSVYLGVSFVFCVHFIY